MTPITRRNALAALAAAGTGLRPAFAADDYPNRPLRMVVPFPAGGGSDTVARAVSQKLGEVFGHPVVVDNRPGAGGNLGTDIVAKAAPDGYTLLMGVVGPLSVNPSLFNNLTYDPMRDFAPITQAVSVTNMLVVHSSVPVNTVRELIDYARKNPGKISIATAGGGTAGHMAAELFKSMTKLEVTLVPYKGAAPAVNDVVGGQVPVCFEAALSTLPHVKTGRLKALAVTTSTRSSQLPNVPTVAESGLPGYVADNWYGFLAPANTPRPIIERLHREMAKILGTPELKDRFAALGADVVANSPQQFGALIASDTAKWKRVVAETGAKME